MAAGLTASQGRLLRLRSSRTFQLSALAERANGNSSPSSRRRDSQQSRSQSWSHSPPSGPVRVQPPRTLRRRSGHLRPSPNPHTNIWKACWGQPLTSSNLVSSAIALTGQYVEGPRSSLRGPSTLVVSVSVSGGRPHRDSSAGIRPASEASSRSGASQRQTLISLGRRNRYGCGGSSRRGGRRGAGGRADFERRRRRAGSRGDRQVQVPADGLDLEVTAKVIDHRVDLVQAEPVGLLCEKYACGLQDPVAPPQFRVPLCRVVRARPARRR